MVFTRKECSSRLEKIQFSTNYMWEKHKSKAREDTGSVVYFTKREKWSTGSLKLAGICNKIFPRQEDSWRIRPTKGPGATKGNKRVQDEELVLFLKKHSEHKQCWKGWQEKPQDIRGWSDEADVWRVQGSVGPNIVKFENTLDYF